MLSSLCLGEIHEWPSIYGQVRSFQMLKIVRFQWQRRLLRRPVLHRHHGQRLWLERDMAEVSGQVEVAEALASRELSGRIKNRRSALHSLQSYWPAARASLVDGLPRLREGDDMKRRRTRIFAGARCERRVLEELPGDATINRIGRIFPFEQGGGVRPFFVDSRQARGFSGHYAEEISDDDYVSSSDEKDPVRFVDQQHWRARLSRFLMKPDTEIVTKEKKDIGDLEHIGDLLHLLGLYGQVYGKVAVISKAPLPNYRPDLDEKRPQREVAISSIMCREIENLLQHHGGQKKAQLASSEVASGVDGRCLERAGDAGPDPWRRDEQFVTRLDARLDVVPDEVLERRNMRIRNKQRSWQESEKGWKMLQLRKTLPAFKEKEALLAAIANHQVLVMSGETGCGKTTQIPQYILESQIEAGLASACNIICTQPRRISAVSVAERVAAERGEELGDSVGYKVRLEGKRGSSTKLLFCTTGILLRRLMSDPDLLGVSHVIVDEIHERGMNEDFLLIVLKDLLPRRPDLRLVLMSATLNAELFSSYFDNAPMMHIPGFTHPVEAYFLEHILEMTGYRLTPINQLDDYGADKAWKKYRQLATRRKRNHLNGIVEDAMADQNFSNLSDRTQASLSCWSADGLGFNLIMRVLVHICRSGREGAVLVFMTGVEDITALMDLLKGHPVMGDGKCVQLVACHGSMVTDEQKLIFEKPPPGVRKIVLATNMAETSITIPDVVFVVDTGKCKETSYDALNNTPCLLPSWISQASARQRRGRAGRMRPGVCYHLYPKAVHDALPEYQEPELLRTPLHSLCLQIKSLQLGGIAAFLSRALQPPEALAVKNSVEFLKTIGALDENEELTHLGQHLSVLPVEPRLGKMLILGAAFRCLEPVLTIAAACTSRDAFVMPMDKKRSAEDARRRFSGQDFSDHMTIVRAYEAWRDAMKHGAAGEFCWRNFLSMQTLLGISSLRRQFMGLLQESGFVDNQQGLTDEYSHDRDLVRAVICAALFPAVVSAVGSARATVFKTLEDGQVLLHSTSVNAQEPVLHYPWLVFNEKLKTSSVFIRDSTGISDSMLLLFGGQLKRGGEPGHLVMRDGYLEFFMKPELADTLWNLRLELDELLQRKLANPQLDIYEEGNSVMRAVIDLLHGDDCEGKWIFGRKTRKSKGSTEHLMDVKGLLFQILQKSGRKLPLFKTREVKGNLFQSMIEVKGEIFLGEPAGSKKQAERNASAMALEWLTGISNGDGSRKQGRKEAQHNTDKKKKKASPSPPVSPNSRKGMKLFRLSA